KSRRILRSATFVRTLITSDAEEFSELRKRYWGGISGLGAPSPSRAAHHGRCHTSVSLGARTYRRQAVGIQTIKQIRPPHRGEITGERRECRPRSAGSGKVRLKPTVAGRRASSIKGSSISLPSCSLPRA